MNLRVLLVLSLIIPVPVVADSASRVMVDEDLTHSDRIKLFAGIDSPDTNYHFHRHSEDNETGSPKGTEEVKLQLSTGDPGVLEGAARIVVDYSETSNNFTSKIAIAPRDNTSTFDEEALVVSAVDEDTTKVGIGTDSPSEKLHVRGGDLLIDRTYSIRISDNEVYFNRNGTSYIYANGDLIIKTFAGDDNLRLFEGGGIRLRNSAWNTSHGHLCTTGGGYLEYCPSSLDHKKEVKAYEGGLDVIEKLRPVSFVWKDSGDTAVGFIAEEVAKVSNQEFTTESAEGKVTGIDPKSLVAVLVNSVKEQQARIDELSVELENIRKNQS